MNGGFRKIVKAPSGEELFEARAVLGVASRLDAVAHRADRAVQVASFVEDVCEAAVGRGIRASGVDRASIYLTTKLWQGNPAWGMPAKTYEQTIAACTKSLT